jgi:integrase
VASIYKDKKTGKYKIAYCPRPHVRRVITGCYDLKATQAIARKLEDEARQIRRGVIDTKAERLAHSEALPLANHLAAFVSMMQGKGVTEEHVKRTEAFIRGVVDACGFKMAGYLDAARVSAHVADLRANGKHARSINARLTAIKSFTRWLFRTERIRTDPMMQVAKLNAKADRQHIRRAMNDDELARLIAAAQTGPDWTWQEGKDKAGAEYHLETLAISGPDRAMLYRLAAETGLRAGELASLTPTNFLLADMDKAAVKVSAAYSKHRRDDLVPLRRDFAQAVVAFLEGKPADVPLFNVPHRTADMLRSDLEAARQAWLKEARTPQDRERREKTCFCVPVDSSGHVLDFHALRHTFITRLARSGITPAVAKSLARHSTITLTMDHYTHTLIGDERAALDCLPTMNPAQPDREAAKATGTYDVAAKDSEKRIALALARSDPSKSTNVITGQHGERTMTAQNFKTCTHLATPATTGHHWALKDLNLGPRDYESPALTAELRARFIGRRWRSLPSTSTVR